MVSKVYDALIHAGASELQVVCGKTVRLKGSQ